MIFKIRSAPHIRSAISNKSVMGDVIVTMFALYFICIFYYGLRPLLTGVLCTAVCFVADMLCCRISGRRFYAGDYSSIVTGMMIPLLLPASAPQYVPVAAGLFAICIVKHAFGGLGHNIFNPAAGGLAFAAVCWPSEVFMFPAPLSSLEVAGAVTAKLTEGSAYLLSVGGVPSSDLTSIVLGLHSGPMGTTNVLVVAACLLFLGLRGTISWRQPTAMILSAALFSLIFPRGGLAPFTSVFYEIFATPMLFAATFVMTDPVTSPKRDIARLLYGFLAGIVVMLVTRFGEYYIPLVFTVLLMNAAAPLFDYCAEMLATRERRSAYEKEEKLDSAAQ